MKLLLTSGGVTNPTIHEALVGMLPRPIEECDALAITTASYAHPHVGPARPIEFLAGREETPMVGLGWHSVGMLELTALPSTGSDRWVQWVHDADVILVNGGEAAYLAHWVRESGLYDLFPSLTDLVWVGLSAGSMVMTPRIGDDFVGWTSPTGAGDRTLGLVDFSIFPHVDNPDLPSNTMGAAERWAAGLGNPSYAIDDRTAIRVVDGVVDVVSEGTWRQLG